jgi:hypothetical protein
MECQKGKETFEQWMKEQIQQVEENLAKKMEGQAAHRRVGHPSSNPRETEETMERWAS